MYYCTFITHCHDFTNHPKQLCDDHTQLEVPNLVQTGLHQILSGFPIQHFSSSKKTTLIQSGLPEFPPYIDDADCAILLTARFPITTTG